MWKKRTKYVVPTMVIVAIAAIFMLTNYYPEVPTYHKALIIISATLFSGLLSAVLFPHDEHKIDPKKDIETKQK